jgi:hypothetical protein
MPDPTAAPETSGDPASTTTDTTAASTATTATTATTDADSTGATSTDAASTKVSPSADPNDWATKRAAYANGDAKLLSRLSRYSSEKDVIDALIAAQNKISSGGLKAPLPDKPTPEELAAWREDNGIPITAKDYGVKVPEGLDSAQVDEFLSVAHDMNMTPAQVEKAISWQVAANQKFQEQRAAQDNLAKEQGIEELRKDWGSECKLNISLITGLLDGAPQGLKDRIMGGRLADGTLIGNDPGMLRWLASLAREVNPTATVVPGSGVNAAQAIQSEMQNLKQMMADRNSEYWKGPKAETHQARFRELADVEAKINKR